MPTIQDGLCPASRRARASAISLSTSSSMPRPATFRHPVEIAPHQGSCSLSCNNNGNQREPPEGSSPDSLWPDQRRAQRRVLARFEPERFEGHLGASPSEKATDNSERRGGCDVENRTAECWKEPIGDINTDVRAIEERVRERQGGCDRKCVGGKFGGDVKRRAQHLAAEDLATDQERGAEEDDAAQPAERSRRRREHAIRACHGRLA